MKRISLGAARGLIYALARLIIIIARLIMEHANRRAHDVFLSGVSEKRLVSLAALVSFAVH